VYYYTVSEPFPSQEYREIAQDHERPHDLAEHQVWENEGGQVERAVKAYRAAEATAAVIERDPEA